MVRRCTDPNCKEYQYYGARGIRICDRWMVLENFDADIGTPPSPDHTLERIDVNGHYEPNNCCWATPKEQARNRRSNVLHEHQGQKRFLDDLAEEYGLPKRTVIDRMRRKGMPLSEALTQPKAVEVAYLEVGGQKIRRTQALRSAGISLPTFLKRLDQGMTTEEALTTPVVMGRPRKTK
ncbi:hypothetical protein LUCX_77 [Xanthomonas phage vB_XciM_LucasX]|nr:hypothetical protein LUCX_77 [Xanthomonas phage vB_XciM_LucasX]